ncbi:hypothetical protein [Spongiactinospora sp. TRM90649]|uniref:hypothetical protein n=1 Tax=Spongiactinospora sp. TRM90649 TaxID=3031114 RepID=UPI0023F8077C|nr:hypothetical protein [Spongiactinospora sp. TRM90649]MDF5757363.1 hypothetical protein [Spongiactinospora sp. TRM90649]
MARPRLHTTQLYILLADEVADSEIRAARRRRDGSPGASKAVTSAITSGEGWK